MERTVSATEARVKFGELMRLVSTEQQRVIVERGGKPQVVVLSIDEYERLKSGGGAEDWREKLARLQALGARLRQGLRKTKMPAPEEIIRQMRQERDEQLASLL